MPSTVAQYRAHFDFDLRFANGGGLSGTGFRLDLPTAAATEDEIARLLIAHLGLAWSTRSICAACASSKSRTGAAAASRRRRSMSAPRPAWSTSAIRSGQGW